MQLDLGKQPHPQIKEQDSHMLFHTCGRRTRTSHNNETNLVNHMIDIIVMKCLALINSDATNVHHYSLTNIINLKLHCEHINKTSSTI